MSNSAQHISQANVLKKKVVVTGAVGLTIKGGTGLCYQRGYATTKVGQTATDAFGSRDKFVEVPDNTNNNAFAGVLIHDVTLNSYGLAHVEIAEPGSVIEVALGVNGVIDTQQHVNCMAGGGDAGRFRYAGFHGRGCAVLMQTKDCVKTAETDGTGSINGNAAGATKGTILTGTDFVSGAVAAGDKVFITAGENDGAGDAIIPGVYIVSSVTSATVLVLTTACTATTADGALKCNYYVVTGNPRALAYLETGEESGLCEEISVSDAGDDASAAFMVGGMTTFFGGVTVAADCTPPLAEGTHYGAKKAFYCLGTLTTKDIIVTLATAGVQFLTDATTGAAIALASIAFDAAAETAVLQWDGKWRILFSTGATLAAS